MSEPVVIAADTRLNAAGAVTDSKGIRSTHTTDVVGLPVRAAAASRFLMNIMCFDAVRPT